MARPSFYFYCYPWDLEDEGLEVSLGRLAGEIGVDGITVAATETDIRMIRGRPLGGRRTFICPAGAHFQPDSAIHRGNRIRPIPAVWMKSKNPLERIAKAADKERLTLRARVILCKGAHLIERFPHAACVNVFGDSSTSHLCPAHADVRQYAAAIVEDLLTNYPIKAVEVAEFGWGWEWQKGEGYSYFGGWPGGLQATISNACFCSSCRQCASASGVNVAATQAALLQAVEDASVSGQGDEKNWPDRFLLIGEYFRAAHQSVVELQQAILGTRELGVLAVIRSKRLEHNPLDSPRMDELCDGLVAQVMRRERQSKGESWSLPAPDMSDAVFYCAPPYVADSQTLVAKAHRAVKKGCRGIEFENYGLCPEPCLDWARQAIRYAKRESGA